MYHAIVRQLMYEMSIYITIIVTFRYTMQSNHQINNWKMYDTNIYIHANYNNNNINDSIYMRYVIALWRNDIQYIYTFVIRECVSGNINRDHCDGYTEPGTCFTRSRSRTGEKWVSSDLAGSGTPWIWWKFGTFEWRIQILELSRSSQIWTIS